MGSSADILRWIERESGGPIWPDGNLLGHRIADAVPDLIL
jgi:hypothetical protein